MSDFGQTILIGALILSTWTFSLALVGAKRRSYRLIHAAEKTLSATTIFLSLAVVLLLYAFAVSDFRFTYVHRYSDRFLPLFYKLTAIWGGQEGSLLIWIWLLALMSTFAVKLNRLRLKELLPYMMVVVALILDGFLLIQLLLSNPFETFLVEQPINGQGLNPLLQDIYMVVHPPALYIGYVGMTIPFAIAMAALLAGKVEDKWIEAARPWALFAWYFLALGLVLGMIWAYKELGWGGYWGWDPVENAGLIPWFTATAMIHAMVVWHYRKRMKMFTMVLVVMTFVLTIFGTFLTRSGFIDSVHAFARSNIGWYFLGFMLLVILCAGGLLIWRRKLLQNRGKLGKEMNREVAFIIGLWVLVVAAFLVLFLTILPTISSLWGNKVSIKPAAFNRWMIPIGLTLLALKGLGSTLGWRRNNSKLLLRVFGIAGVFGVLVTLALALLGLGNSLALFSFGLCAFVICIVVQDFVRAVRVRKSSNGKEGALGALMALLKTHGRRYGGYIVHAGMVMMFVGFIGEAYKTESQAMLHKGERKTVGRYTLRYDGMKVTEDAQKQMFTAELTVYIDNQFAGVIRPARWVYFRQPDQPTSEVDVRRTVKEDLFVVLGDFEADGDTAAFKIIVNPLVNWIWIGFLILTFGAAIAYFPFSVKRVRLMTVYAGKNIAGIEAPPTSSQGFSSALSDQETRQ